MDQGKLREIGADGYLEKPHEKKSLARMVRQVLNEKASRG
jgi:DNA-binding response OmpR family regulator